MSEGRFRAAPLHDRMPLEEATLAETLREAGYRTFFAGKWHLGPTEEYWPENQGFEVNRGGWSRGGPYGGKQYFSPYGNPRLEDGPDGEHLPDRLATEAVRFIVFEAEERFSPRLKVWARWRLQGPVDVTVLSPGRPLPVPAWPNPPYSSIWLVPVVSALPPLPPPPESRRFERIDSEVMTLR